MQVSEFWREVRAREAEISDEFPHIVSIEAPLSGMRGGVVVQVERRVAAELLVRGTHRLASVEEIEVHRRKESVAAALAQRGPNPQPVVYLKRK